MKKIEEFESHGIEPKNATFNPIRNNSSLKVHENAQPQTYIERLKEKKEPSLGERNPLLFPPDLKNQEAFEAIQLVTLRKIEEHGGLPPTTMRIAYLPGVGMGPVPRLLVQFRPQELPEDRLTTLEHLVGKTYGSAVRTRRKTDGSPSKPERYPELEQKKQSPQAKGHQDTSGSKLGWYMGSNMEPTNVYHMGLFVYKNLGDVGMARLMEGRTPKDWFSNDDLMDPISHKPLKTAYHVEIREADMYQTDLVEFIVQASSILGTGNIFEHRDLLYEIYNDLNRLGLKKAGKEQIYGLDDTIDRIERVLMLPLANLNFTAGVALDASSVLLVGVPGTGKTLVAEHFLREDTGVFLVPLDPLHLATELTAPPHQKKLMPRISDVFNQTQRPVVLHIDDVEMIGKGQDAINSALLNLMAGVRQTGFYVIASTNYPEMLSAQLMQPERFGDVEYFGLPPKDARKGILNVHAIRVSKELGIPLFPSDEEREIVLEALAEETEHFTARFLKDICNEAKTFMLQRIAKRLGRKTQITEDVLKELGETFTREDWAEGYNEVRKKYDKDATVRRNNEIKTFAERYNRQNLGFHTNANGHKESIIFNMEQIAAKRAPETT